MQPPSSSGRIRAQLWVIGAVATRSVATLGDGRSTTAAQTESSRRYGAAVDALQWLAIFVSLLAAIGFMGRLMTDSRPTRASFRDGGVEPQLQVFGYLFPYLLAGAAVLWLAYIVWRIEA